jgi:hypothetical protein
MLRVRSRVPRHDRTLVASNGPAYQRDEVRHGPPLDYIGEKARNALEATHRANREFRELQAASEDDLEALDLQLRVAFGYQLKAHLALYNMLGSCDNNAGERLLAMSHDEFDRWLDFIEREGSTTGA